MTEKWMTNNYFVSPCNFEPEVVEQFQFPKSLEIHDVTLRDGEQQPGVVFTKQDKIKIAKMLSEAGVHRIEAGMPAVSKQDEEAIGEIVKLKLKSKIFVFCRAKEDDIEKAALLGVDGVVIEIPTNNELIEFGYQWPLDRPIDAAINACKLAHEKGLFVTLFLMDSSRLTVERFIDIVKTVQQKGWVDSCSVVDTQGTFSTPGVRYFISEAVKNLNIPVEAHLHNDLGIGTANALAAFEAGASVLHTTTIGLGPRAGQSATEQVAIALKLLYGYDSGVKLERLYDLGIEIGKIANVIIPGNQAVLGDKVYLIEAGMPASWWPKVQDEHPLSLYGILPSVMGQPPIKIVLGKGSGSPSIRYWLNKLHLSIKNEDDVSSILDEVKGKGLKEKRGLTEDEFVEIVSKYS